MSSHNLNTIEPTSSSGSHQIALFDISPPLPLPKPDPRPRGKQIDNAFTKANASFIASYEAHLLYHGLTNADFTACEVTEAYTAKYHKLSPKQNKQLGGLYQRLIGRGVIEKTGIPRERNQGNLAMVYRLTKKPE